MRHYIRLFAVGALLALAFDVTPAAQSINTQIQIAINQLVTGVTPFQILRMIAGGYVNFGSLSGASGYGFRDNAGTIQFKNDGGGWVSLPASGTFPTGAPYITRTPDSDLSNEFALSTLATALLINTTGTGVPTAYAGATCTNQFVRALSATGGATCQSVDVTADVTGIVPVANGGTGLGSGTSGGILGYTATGTLASSVALTNHQIVIGRGAAATPVPLGSVGTTTQVLHGSASGDPSFGAVVLTTDVSGILPVANGGTNNAFFTVSGPATTAKTYTFPNSNSTILTDAAAVTAAQGGTGQTSYTIGDLLYASGATALSKLAGVATGNVLLSGGVATSPAWGKVGLTTHVTGTLPVANGGTNLTSYTVGDIIYASGATAFSRLAAVATGSVLCSAGVTTAPGWCASPTVTSLTAVSTTNLGATTGDTIQTLSTTATNDDPTEIVRQYRVATTDATPTALATIALDAFKTTQFQCWVTARRTGGVSGTAEDGAAYNVQVAYKVVGGAATEIAAETLTVIGEDQAGWTVTWAPSAGNAVMSVTGAASNNVTWHATCRSYAVGS